MVLSHWKRNKFQISIIFHLILIETIISPSFDELHSSPIGHMNHMAPIFQDLPLYCTKNVSPNSFTQIKSLSAQRQHSSPLPLDRHPHGYVWPLWYFQLLKGGFQYLIWAVEECFFDRRDPSILANMLIIYPAIGICSKNVCLILFTTLYF